MSRDRFIWAPRVLAIVFILFISLFALDAFGGEESFGMQLLGFLIHLAPSFILAILLVFSWNRPCLGACTFGVATLAFCLWFRTYTRWPSFVGITVPMIVVSLLFALAYWRSGRNKTFRR